MKPSHPVRLALLLSAVLIAVGLVAVRAQGPSAPGAPAPATATLRADTPGPVVNPNIYGHFAEHLGRGIYEGIWVGPDSPIPNTRGIRNDVLAALKALDIPVLRWPGGCFADEYHWRDGIGLREKRPAMINTHWGGVVENNHFGTHEFMDLVELLGTNAYVSGNVGSGTVQEMMEWVEYMTSPADSPLANLRRQNGRDKPWRVPYFGVGNENWGCGGTMRPEYYADEFRRYNTFIKNYDRANPIYRIACGASDENVRWTEVLMGAATRQMNGLSLHYYTLPTGSWGRKGSAIDFGEDQWFSTLRRTLRMDDFITRHAAVMDKSDPEKRVGMVVDEWGAWYDVEPDTEPGFLYQQSTLRDALVAALNFHIFQRHADRVVMANIAQTVNVLQAVILTDKEKMLRTPTYWVFEMFKVHQGGRALPVELQSPDYAFGQEKISAVSASATRTADGAAVHLSLANTSPANPVTLTVALKGVAPTSVSGRILTAPAINAHNTFAAPDTVKPAPFEGAALKGDRLEVRLPAKSVVMLVLAPGSAPATPSELTADPKGWEDLLADGSLNEWSRVPLGPAGQLRAGAASDPSPWRFDRARQLLVCEGEKAGHEMFRHAAELDDHILHAEFRFAKLEGEPPYNSGIYVRTSADGAIWHQAQTGPGGGFIFGNTPMKGAPQRVNLRNAMLENRVKPAGEWNTYEVRAEGNRIALWVNGALVNEFDQCEVPKGHVGLEAEGFRIEFRNLKVKRLR